MVDIEAQGLRNSDDSKDGTAAELTIYRHPLPVRAFHWINVICFVILIMSGYQIFNAHPRLYIGNTGYYDTPAVFEITGDKSLTDPHSWIQIGSVRIPVTGVLGKAEVAPYVGVQNTAFPSWITLPSAVGDLGHGRGWHFLMIWFFAANLIFYLGYCLISKRLVRQLLPSRAQLRPKAILHDIWMHVRLRHAKGEQARHYNLMQKLSYIVVLFGLLPTMILSGMTMSPASLAVFPWLLDLFQGRQTARTIHFVSANLRTPGIKGATDRPGSPD